MTRTLPTVTGEIPNVNRIKTGLWSFNRATDGGIPARIITELSGYAGCGKSTLAMYLAGACNRQGKIVFANFEDFDYEYAQRSTAAAGFDGELYLAKTTEEVKGERVPASAETTLKDLLHGVAFGGASAAIVDSVGAIVPTAELEGELDDAQVGARARLMAKFLRAVSANLKTTSTPCNLFMTNHVHAVVGGRGTLTSGGVAVQYLSSLRIRLSKSREMDNDALVVTGKLDKLKFKSNLSDGDKYRTFKVFILPGLWGVHEGLTAMEDCVDQGLAEYGATVKLGGKSMGRISKLIEQYEDPDAFVPFQKALEEL